MTALKRAHFRFVPWALALLGVVIIVGEVVRNWVWRHPIEGWVIAIGAGFGFFGFYVVQPAAALQAFGFVVDSGIRIVGVIRTGRRSTDVAVAVQTKETAPSDPKVEPATAVVKNDPEVP